MAQTQRRHLYTFQNTLHGEERELIPRAILTMGAIQFPSTASIAGCVITVCGNSQGSHGLQHVKQVPPAKGDLLCFMIWKGDRLSTETQMLILNASRILCWI